MKKPKPPTLNELKEERNALLLSKDNPNRLSEIQAKIDYIEWGIVNPKQG